MIYELHFYTHNINIVSSVSLKQKVLNVRPLARFIGPNAWRK